MYSVVCVALVAQCTNSGWPKLLTTAFVYINRSVFDGLFHCDSLNVCRSIAVRQHGEGGAEDARCLQKDTYRRTVSRF